MRRVKARKDAISARSSQGVERWLKGLKSCRVIEGHARFDSPRQFRVNGETLTADRIFINVGARALVPSKKWRRLFEQLSPIFPGLGQEAGHVRTYS